MQIEVFNPSSEFGCILIPLTQGAYTIVDDNAPEWVFEISWHLHRSNGNVYARGKRKGEKIFLHRLLTRAPRGLVVDHVNGNSLDNRLTNLRRCKQSTNMKNRCKSWIERANETKNRRAPHERG